MMGRSLRELMRLAPVIPVIVIDRIDDAAPLAQALVAGGIRVLEITLRTEAALAAMAAMATVDGAIVGAGTVLNGAQLAAARAAGAQFAVSPGLTPGLIEAAAAQREQIALLPGVATASELMRAREAGFHELKFFPAEAAGGIAMLKSFASVFRDVSFCPTGGITPASAPAYLGLPNVSCVGGSWLAPAEAVRSGDWEQVTRLARAALTLRA